MKNLLYALLFLVLMPTVASANLTTSVIDFRTFADAIFTNVQTRPDCTYTMDIGDHINLNTITDKIRKKSPNLVERFGVTFQRECAGDPKGELNIVWIVEKIENTCIAGAIVNAKRNFEMDKELTTDACALQNYLQLANTSASNPWWKWSTEIALNSSW